jgi:sugar phosphate isomerase/epimerase
MSRAMFGATTFSFTPEHFHGLSRREILALIAGLDGEQHLELVGPQHLDGYPDVSADQLLEVRRELDELGLTPSCICGFVDIGADPNRIMDEAQIIDELLAQIRATAGAGFPILRVQHATPRILEEIVRDAELANVKLAVEINSPHTIGSPPIQSLLELFDRLQSPNLGFVADFGATARRLSQWLADAYRAKFVPEGAIKLVWERWLEPNRPDRMRQREELEQTLRAEDYGEAAIRLGNHAMVLFGREEPKRWLDVLPHVLHTHVKLYEVDQAGIDHCIPYDELLPMFVDAGYTGVYSWEYEGWLWAASAPSVAWAGLPAVDAIGRHQRHVRTMLE